MKEKCKKVMVARSIEEAQGRIRDYENVSLVLSDLQMVDGDAFQLLEFASSLKRPKLQIILLAEKPSSVDMERAIELGAIGYLTAPVSFREIAQALRQREPTWANRPRRRRVDGIAKLLDSDEAGSESSRQALLVWDIRDLSSTGAFLEANCPIPIETELWLEFEFYGASAALVHARVVRVQEPSWDHVAGIGVVFTKIDSESQEMIDDYIDESEGIFGY